MITRAFAQMVYYCAISWPAYGGEDGLSILVRNQFPGVNTMRPLGFFFICYVVLLAALSLFVLHPRHTAGHLPAPQRARQSDVSGERGCVRVCAGGCCILQTHTKQEARCSNDIMAEYKK